MTNSPSSPVYPIHGSSDVATGFHETATGPIALIGKHWYSVNGTRKLITDIRFRIDADAVHTLIGTDPDGVPF